MSCSLYIYRYGSYSAGFGVSICLCVCVRMSVYMNKYHQPKMEFSFILSRLHFNSHCTHATLESFASNDLLSHIALLLSSCINTCNKNSCIYTIYVWYTYGDCRLQCSGKFVHSVNKSKMVRDINNTYINGSGNNHNPFFLCPFVIYEQDRTRRYNMHKHKHKHTQTQIQIQLIFNYDIKIKMTTMATTTTI